MAEFFDEIDIFRNLNLAIQALITMYHVMCLSVVDHYSSCRIFVL